MPENLDDKNFVVLNLYDVVKLHKNVAYLMELNTSEFKESYLIVEELKLSILSIVFVDLSHRFYLEIQKKLFDYGLDTWILRSGAQSWKKGKLKVELTVRFYPDEFEEEIEENKAENYDKNNSEVLEEYDVLQIDQSTGKNLGLSLEFESSYMSVMSVGQLQSLIIKTVGIHNNDIKNQLFYDNYDGVECEVLRPGDQGWKKGKLKVDLPVKFYLDETQEEIEENELSNSENQGENYGDNNSEVMATEPSPLDDLRQKFHQENQYKLSGKILIYVGYFVSLHISYYAQNHEE